MPKVTFKICPYLKGSKSVKQLRHDLEERLGHKVVTIPPDYMAESNERIINWGNSGYQANRRPGATNVDYFNSAPAVARSINKIHFFKCLEKSKLPIPDWTTDVAVARLWLDKHKVFCRTQIAGRDGKGIVVASKPSELVEAPLYTKLVPSTREYRVFVFRNQAIYNLTKMSKPGANLSVPSRTRENGWFYSMHQSVPEEAQALAVDVCQVLGLDFCAVDILFNAKNGKFTVLESNSAPGTRPSSRAVLINAFLGT